MSAEEFNEKYKEYISPRFRDGGGLMFDDEQVGDYLDSRMQELIDSVPFLEIYQIKVKFGRISFLANTELDIKFEIEKDLNEIVNE